jgi:hypothetical protein
VEAVPSSNAAAEAPRRRCNESLDQGGVVWAVIEQEISLCGQKRNLM